jgi:membrane-associated protease RseP (regulator of RpoE activity)
MKLKALLGLAALALVSSSSVVRSQEAAAPPASTAPPAQTTPPAAVEAPAPPAAFAAALLNDGPFLGIHVEEVTRANITAYGLSGEPRGVGVRSVVKGSPAERAGLREHDVIVRFDGEAVSSVRKLTRLIGESAPDHTARMTILRGGSEQELTATLAAREVGMQSIGGEMLPGFNSAEARAFAERFKDGSQQWQLEGDEMRKELEELQRAHPGALAFGTSRRIGVATSPFGHQLADYFGVSNGLLVNSVEANSPAEKAGLKAGDVITEAAGQRVEDAGDLVRALGGKDDGEVTLTVVRERKQRTVRVKPERREPQGFLINPGAFSVEAPVAALALPRIAVPRALVAPSAWVAPRAATAPRVRVMPPRVRVLNFGDRIL